MQAIRTESEGVITYSMPVIDDEFKAVKNFGYVQPTPAPPAPIVTVFESSTPGTYSVTLEGRTYEIILVGGGGNGSELLYFGRKGGGSGAMVAGSVYIPAGTYTVVVGGSEIASTFYNQVAGGGSKTNGGSYTITENTLTGTYGNSGGNNSSGQSVYGGYGAGGAPGNGNYGGSGYVKITGV